MSIIAQRPGHVARWFYGAGTARPNWPSSVRTIDAGIRHADTRERALHPVIRPVNAGNRKHDVTCALTRPQVRMKESNGR